MQEARHWIAHAFRRDDALRSGGGRYQGRCDVVDDVNKSVIEWWAQFGFTRFEPSSLKMFVPMATVRNLLGVGVEPSQAG
jgi:hypothetical protein